MGAMTGMMSDSPRWSSSPMLTRSGSPTKPRSTTRSAPVSASRVRRLSGVASMSRPSLPLRPTAVPPSALIVVTICLLMEPASTISTTSMAAASVTRKAVDEVALDAQAGEHLGDLRAAAVDHNRVDADLLQQHDVAREALGERGVAHGVAAILDDHAPAREAPHVGQRLGDRGRGAQPMLGVADALHGVPGRSQAPAR